MFSIALLQQDGGLTIGDIIADIPHDLPAIIVYVLLAGFVYLIWRGSRPSSKRKEPS